MKPGLIVPALSLSMGLALSLSNGLAQNPSNGLALSQSIGPAQSPSIGPPAAVAAQTKPSGDPLDALVADSPFLPGAGARRTTSGGAAGPLELRGIVFEDGAYRFSIYDQASKQGAWVRLAETGQPFVARSFNRERDALTVEHQGRTVVLELQAAHMASATAAQPPPSPAPLSGPGPGNQPVQNNQGNAGPPATVGPGPNSPTVQPAGATTAAEAQRLQNLADEIRRRRGRGPVSLPTAPPKN